MKAIVATDKLWNIGVNNKLLFKIKDDMERFKELTTGKIVVMGRKTFDSIGRALPNRINLVVTSQYLGERDDIIYGDFFRISKELQKYNQDDIFIIGGKEIYRYYLADIDTFYHTLLDDTYRNADVRIEDLSLIGYALTESKEAGLYNNDTKFYFNIWSSHCKYKSILRLLTIDNHWLPDPIYCYIDENDKLIIKEDTRLASKSSYIKEIVRVLKLKQNLSYKIDLERSVVDKNKARAIIDIPYVDLYFRVRGIRPIPYSLTIVGFGNDEDNAKENLLSMIDKVCNLR